MTNVVPLDPLARTRRARVCTPDVLTVAQTAQLLGPSVNTTYAYLADGTIPAGGSAGAGSSRAPGWMLGSPTRTAADGLDLADAGRHLPGQLA